MLSISTGAGAAAEKRSTKENQPNGGGGWGNAPPRRRPLPRRRPSQPPSLPRRPPLRHRRPPSLPSRAPSTRPREGAPRPCVGWSRTWKMTTCWSSPRRMRRTCAAPSPTGMPPSSRRLHLPPLRPRRRLRRPRLRCGCSRRLRWLLPRPLLPNSCDAAPPGAPAAAGPGTGDWPPRPPAAAPGGAPGSTPGADLQPASGPPGSAPGAGVMYAASTTLGCRRRAAGMRPHLRGAAG